MRLDLVTVSGIFALGVIVGAMLAYAHTATTIPAPYVDAVPGPLQLDYGAVCEPVSRPRPWVQPRGPYKSPSYTNKQREVLNKLVTTIK